MGAHAVAVGETVSVGAVIATIGDETPAGIPVEVSERDAPQPAEQAPASAPPAPAAAAPTEEDHTTTLSPAVRRAVLEWKEYRANDVMAMAVQTGIPEAERQSVVDYARQEFDGLHEGNVIRYRLRPVDLEAVRGRPSA